MLSLRIKSLRIRADLSQAKLAAQLKIGTSAVGMYEQGRRTPDLDTLVAMSQIFDVSLDYLITGEEHIYSDTTQAKATVCPCANCFWKDLNK